MRINKMIKFFALAAAAVMMISSAAVLSGCGGDNKKTESSAATTSAASAAESTTAGTDGGTQQSSEIDVQDNNNSSDTDQDEEKHGNITAEEAADIALQNCPYGLRVTVCDPSTYDDQDCWRVMVRETSGGYVECYVSSTFCYLIDSNDSN